MGLFGRKTKATVPVTYFPPSHPPPPAVATYYPPPPWSPPEQWEQYAPSSQPAEQSTLQHFHRPVHAHSEQLVSAADFHAIQNALNANTIIDQFDTIFTNIDADRWNENDEDSFLIIEEQREAFHIPAETTRGFAPARTRGQGTRTNRPMQQKITIASKVALYANSRLPTDLSPIRLYINTWPLICLAAQYSRNVYLSPQNAHERSVFLTTNTRLGGTKAIVMKSVSCDDKKTIVFAIRGTTFSVRDWFVNLDNSLVSPSGFLDDEGNLCHSGFLKVAKNMIQPIALRLRTLLQENPNRAHCSLLITGHSAGGAIAALIFNHMLSNVQSELSNLMACFKRVHCITFGAPPVTLLPLMKPDLPKYAKYQFMSFLNEGDPIVRAEAAYIKSLYNLLSAPVPIQPKTRKQIPRKSSYARLQNSISRLDLSLSKLDLTSPAPKPTNNNNLHPEPSRVTFDPSASTPLLPSSHSGPIWPIPTATLSNAGRLILMRTPSRKLTSPAPTQQQATTSSNRWEVDNLTRVTAHKVTDEQLRDVVFGDPTMHAMEVYLRRVDMLALRAVTART